MTPGHSTPPQAPKGEGPRGDSARTPLGDFPGEPVTQWYRPSWRDGLRYVGYRWIFLTPVAVLVVLAVATIWHPSLATWLLRFGYKLITVVAGVTAWLFSHVVRQAAQGRKEPFCIFCGYNLTGLPDNYRCPECGRPYTWAMIAEYRRDPQWFIERWNARRQLPGAPEPFDAGPVRRKKRARDGTE
jgi:hypothetical protein